jgi:hypothetical protein
MFTEELRQRYCLPAFLENLTIVIDLERRRGKGVKDHSMSGCCYGYGRVAILE